MASDAVSEELSSQWHKLSTLWLESEQLWNDSVRRDFEKKYMTPLQEETLATMKEMAKLMEVLARVQREINR